MSYTVEDKGTVLAGVCTDAGTAVDLTGCTVELHIRVPDSTNTVLTRAATVDDAAAGGWSYVWQVDELTVAGIYKVEAQVTSADGAIVQTFGPDDVEVRNQIG